jgi:hypothetical protein
MPENYILLERTELNASAASVTFANIPQTGYTDLKIVYSARSNSTSGYAETVNMKFNNSSTSDYTWRGLYSVTATPGSNNSGGSVAQIRAGNVPSANLTASTFSNNEIYIPNYTSANFKSVSIDAVSEVNGSTDFTYTLMLQAGLRSNTAAITDITLSLDAAGTSFVAGSTFSLYGIAAVGATPTIAPKASGGNIIDYDGTYWIHTFLTSGTFTPQANLTCDYLMVAGGGAGGVGGGGAGGLRSTVGATGGNGTLESAISLTNATNYSVVVGGGGAGVLDARGASGSNSSISGTGLSTITATGGGAGGYTTGTGAGLSGGSGGGGGHNGTHAGGTAASPTQGFAGGSTPNTLGGSGGGGAGAVGANSAGEPGANGGNGNASSITGTSVTRGGGGGGGGRDTTPGTGGSGGGGNGGTTPNVGGAGTTNLGGGGGGRNWLVSGTGGNGGSGVVIIRYPAA